jgi:hypothetical protein
VVLETLAAYPALFPATSLILEHEPAFTLEFVRGVLPRFVELVTEALAPAAKRIPAIAKGRLSAEELAEVFVRATSSSYFLPGENTDKLIVWLERLAVSA